MKKLILTTILIGLIAAPALANITITPDDGQYYTYQRWDFDTGVDQITTGPNEVAGSSQFLNLAPNISYNPYGAPLADVFLTGRMVGINPPLFESGWYISKGGASGVMYGDTVQIDL